jgi:hypothetical protein
MTTDRTAPGTCSRRCVARPSRASLEPMRHRVTLGPQAIPTLWNGNLCAGVCLQRSYKSLGGWCGLVLGCYTRCSGTDRVRLPCSRTGSCKSGPSSNRSSPDHRAPLLGILLESTGPSLTIGRASRWPPWDESCAMRTTLLVKVNGIIDFRIVRYSSCEIFFLLVYIHCSSTRFEAPTAATRQNSLDGARH